MIYSIQKFRPTHLPTQTQLLISGILTHTTHTALLACLRAHVSQEGVSCTSGSRSPEPRRGVDSNQLQSTTQREQRRVAKRKQSTLSGEACAQRHPSGETPEERKFASASAAGAQSGARPDVGSGNDAKADQGSGVSQVRDPPVTRAPHNSARTLTESLHQFGA